MEFDRRELKRQARQAMSQASPPFWLVTLVYILATTGLSYLMDTIPFATDPVTGFGTAGLFASILLTLYTLVMDFGFKLWSLWTHRKLDPGMGSLMQGFSVAGRVLLLELFIFSRIFGWTLLFSFVASVPMLFISASLPAMTWALSLLLYIPVWIISLRYSLSHFLLADHPDDGPSAAINRSVRLMEGWKMEYFKLDLSFLGWELVNGVLSAAVLAFFLLQRGSLQFGSLDQFYSVYVDVSYLPMYILLSFLVTLPVTLWLRPYREVSRAGFYDARLRLQRESAPQL